MDREKEGNGGEGREGSGGGGKGRKGEGRGGEGRGGKGRGGEGNVHEAIVEVDGCKQQLLQSFPENCHRCVCTYVENGMAS